MDGILSDLGKRIADRWFTFLILPGVPFAATVIVAWAMTPPEPPTHSTSTSWSGAWTHSAPPPKPSKASSAAASSSPESPWSPSSSGS